MSLSVLELSVEDLSEQLRANAVSAIAPTTLENTTTRRLFGTSSSNPSSSAVSGRADPPPLMSMAGQLDQASPIGP